jgi:hypothetical protein
VQWCVTAKDEQVFICDCMDKASSSTSTGEDNAHLIAAAPDLLEALKALDECYCEAGAELSKEDRHRHRLALMAARAAIAKATVAA